MCSMTSWQTQPALEQVCTKTSQGWSRPACGLAQGAGQLSELAGVHQDLTELVAARWSLGSKALQAVLMVVIRFWL